MPLACEINRNHKKGLAKFHYVHWRFLKKIRPNFWPRWFPCSEIQQISKVTGTYCIITNPWTILFWHRASSQICHETVPEKKKQRPRSQRFSASTGENPEEVEVHQYSCLDVTSILFIDACLPSLFKSWRCGPVKWLTEETTNQFKSNAGSYLRVKNRSIGREREKKLSERRGEPTNLSHTSVEGRIEPGQRWWKATALTTAPTLSSQRD